MTTKYQKFLSTNDHHDENNFECLARPIPEIIHVAPSAFHTNNNHITKPKPFPLYKQLHENLCK